MKPFIFTLCLGMIRTRMTYSYSQSNQPSGQLGQFVKLIVSPWAAIVHRHPIWEPISPERADQGGLNCRSSFIGASLEHQIKPRMIVNNRQGMTPPLSHGKVTFKIHLPKSIGIRMLETNESL